MKVSTILRPVLLCVIVLLSCSKDDNPLAPKDTDSQAPSINITTPSSKSVYATLESTITLSGTASDNKGLKEITWLSSTGASGTATGLENWTIENISLNAGDNTIMVTASDNDKNTTVDTIIITRNQYVNFLTIPKLNPSVIFKEEQTDVTIKVSAVLSADVDETELVLVKVDQNNTVLSEYEILYDNGDLSIGDDIKGDGVFSTIQSIYEEETGELRYRISAKTQKDGDEIVEFSSYFTITIIEQFLSEDAESNISVQEDADEQLQEFLEDNSLKTALELTKDWLLEQPDVESATVTESGNISIEYSTGLKGIIIFSTEGEEGGSSAVADQRNSVPAIPPELQTIGECFLSAGKRAADSEAVSENAVLNKNVLLFAPRYTEFTSWGTEFLDNTEDILEDSTKPEFDVTYLKDSACTVSSLSNLTQYGLIVIHTHGGTMRNDDVIFATGEEMTAVSIEAHSADWAGGRLTAATIAGTTYWAITPAFIDNLDGSFPNSIIYNGSCESAHNNTMADAFISQNANTYFGFSETVYSSFDEQMADDLFPELITNHKTTGESFTANQHDGHTDKPAYFVMIGNDKTYFEAGLINGDFETGDLTGWNKDGDGRVITQLGNLLPQSGMYMSIISTGLGYTTSTGSISQKFVVAEDEETMTFKWNFLSEEFMEYVGSIFQDYFKITITADSNVTVIYEKAIDTYAAEYDLIKVSPTIVFDRGDVYMTGWQDFSYDISAYQGDVITIEFSAGDIGDSIYDTALLLDNIEIK